MIEIRGYEIRPKVENWVLGAKAVGMFVVIAVIGYLAGYATVFISPEVTFDPDLIFGTGNTVGWLTLWGVGAITILLILFGLLIVIGITIEITKTLFEIEPVESPNGAKEEQ